MASNTACPPGFPKFEGVNMSPGQSFDESQAAALPPPPAFPPPPMQAQNSGVRVPPLTPDRVADYTRLLRAVEYQKGARSMVSLMNSKKSLRIG
jgi:hypothetical protein